MQLESPGTFIVNASIDFVVVSEVMASVRENLHCLSEQMKSDVGPTYRPDNHVLVFCN